MDGNEAYFVNFEYYNKMSEKLRNFFTYGWVDGQMMQELRENLWNYSCSYRKIDFLTNLKVYFDKINENDLN